MTKTSNTITTPTVTDVQVTMDANGALDKTDSWGDPVLADRVQWSAHLGQRGLVVRVTGYAADHQNQTWVDSRYFVADGLNCSEPPAWVPIAPVWFWAAVEGMRA